MLATWSRCWRCTLINSRATQNIFAATVNGTRNRKVWITVLPKFLKQRDVTLQRKAISQKLLQVALHTVYLHSFTVLASCKSVSTTSFLVTKKFDNQHRQRLSSKFKVNSTCPYIRSIRNYGILIYCYARAVSTEQYPATLTNILLLLHAKRSDARTVW